MSVEKYIDDAFKVIDWQREPYGLYEPIEYTLASAGKRLRPRLVLMASDMFDGKRLDALPAAIAIELFHNFTLIHDDVMDNADTRRSLPTVHRRWNANTAILSGDQMMIEAYSYLVHVPEQKLPLVLAWFSEMATGICEGQQYDMDFEKRSNVTKEEYIRMITLKTSVLIANALRTGAYIAGAGGNDIDMLYAFGIDLGLAFQLQDDLLDMYGNPKTFGKPIGGDVLEAKKTYLLLTALELATEGQRDRLVNLLADNDIAPQQKIDGVREIYDSLGVRQIVEHQVEVYTHSALEHLIQVDVVDPLKQPLSEIAIKLINRNK